MKPKHGFFGTKHVKLQDVLEMNYKENLKYSIYISMLAVSTTLYTGYGVHKKRVI